MNIKDTFHTEMSATQSQLPIAVNAPYDGWYGPIHFKFQSAFTGNIALQIIRDDVVYTVASNALTAKTDSSWSGSVFCKHNDLLRIQKIGSGAVDISVNITHDSVGSNEWDDFVEETIEESSSSSSSSLEYSSSSSSEGYTSSSSSDSSGGYSSSSSSSSSSS